MRAVALPVLHALFGHGVVLEPHLQNVLVGVDRDGRPAQAIFRDMEGTKLLTPRHEAVLATLKPGVARALGYDAARGWNRVAYCLFVNHLAEIAAAVADRHPDQDGQFEAAMWRRAARTARRVRTRARLAPAAAGGARRGPAARQGQPPAPLGRGADREAAYLAVRNPLRGQQAGRARAVPPAC